MYVGVLCCECGRYVGSVVSMCGLSYEYICVRECVSTTMCVCVCMYVWKCGRYVGM